MRSIVVAAVMLLMCVTIVKPAAARQASGYYEHTELTYSINADRSVSVVMEFTIVNTSPPRIYITGAPWYVQAAPEDIDNIRASDDVGLLPPPETRREGKATIITVKFRGDGISPGSRLTYRLSFTARGLVTGSGSQYTGWLGNRTLLNFPHRSYIVNVQGPAGTGLFLTDPPPPLTEVLSIEPPAVRYETDLDANEKFGGLRVTSYSTPVYYKVTLVERVSNPSGEASDIVLDLLLFNHGQSQFAALVDSNPPLATMHVDEEGNWYGGIELGLEPGGSQDVTLELIWACEIHSPEIDNRGTLDEIPGGLLPFLKEDEFWECEDPAIELEAAETVGDEKNAYLVAEHIVDRVSQLEYVRVEERQGALRILRSGYGDCDCFSDLTIALARAIGLPARLSFGWAYGEENFGGHAWVEFYLPRAGWQPADPTWARTSGDYLFKSDSAHILRGRRGLTSSNSAVSRTSYGGNPKVAPETSSSDQLETSEAAGDFVQAAEATLGIAERLAAGEEAMDQKLRLARQKLIEASSASGEDAIRLARESLRHSNEIIQAFGEPLELGARVHWWFFLVLAGAIVGGGIAVILAIRSRGRVRSQPHMV